MPERSQPLDGALRAHADLGLDAQREAVIVARVTRQISEPSAAPTRRVRRPRRRVSVGIGIAAALALTGAATAATGLWTPSLGDDQRGHPTVSSADVPAEQLQHFGVLRRAPDATDRDTTTSAALRYLNGHFQGVHTESIRAAHRTPAGRRYLIVPVERSDSGVRDALCLYAVDGEGGGLSCWSTAQILGGQARLIALADAQPATKPKAGDLESLRPSITGATTIGLVPDGVASVTGADGAQEAVHDNVFVLTTSQPDAAITWLDADGNAVPQG